MRRKILATGKVFAAVLGLFGCKKAEEKTVVSVSEMTLTLRGMRGGTVYRYEIDGERTELCRYYEKYYGEETVLELDASVECTPQSVLELMNACGVIYWDGFHGEHPKNVLDGIMFTFSATVNGGQTIYADGSANFPKGYHEFVRALGEMLAESKNN